MASAEFELKRIADALEHISETIQASQPEFIADVIEYLNNPALLQKRIFALVTARRKNPEARLGLPRKIK